MSSEKDAVPVSSEELDEDAAVGFPGGSSAGGQAVSAWLTV